jgi:hypothetical protein
MMRRKRKFQEKRCRYALLISKNAATGLLLPSLLTKNENNEKKEREQIYVFGIIVIKIKCTVYANFSLCLKIFYTCTLKE